MHLPLMSNAITSTLPIFMEHIKKVFANEVKQSNAIFKGGSDLDCFANARKDEYLNRFKKMGKVEITGLPGKNHTLP